MKNKKLLKAIAATMVCSAMGLTAFSFAACNPGEGDGGEDGGKHTHNYTWVDDENGLTHHRHCDVEGCPEPDKPSEDHTLAGEECTKCHAELKEEDRAIVPVYKGEATGPESGTKQFTSRFLADDLPKTALAEEYNNGVVTIPAGTNFRSQADKSGKYDNSVQNGTFTIKVPVAGKLTISYSSGSSTKGNASYSLQKPDGTDTQVINADSKVLQTLEIDAVPGTYVFSTAKGTVNTYEIVLEYTNVASPIKEIEVSNPGTTDYLVTQKVNCTGVTLIAKDEAGAIYPVNLENCKFDTTKYLPGRSGEYEIGVTYYLSSNLDSATKEFTATYKVKVYMVDAIELSTIGLASSKQVTVQQAYLPNGTFSKDYLSVIATCNLGNSTIQQKLKDDWMTVSTPTLTAEGTQTVTVSVDSKYTTGNKAVSASYDVVVKAKKEVVDSRVEVTVGATGEFKTLTQAVQYLKACGYEASVNKVIKLQAGTYTEKVWLDIENVTLIGLGENIDDTVLSYSLVEGDADKLSGSLWALNCATLHVTDANFKAYNLAIHNDFDYIANNKNYSGSQAAQGVALTLEGDGNVLYNCHLYGNQDTLYMKNGRSYFKDSQIDGNIDFIFGGEKGLAYFEECKIVAIDREAKESADPQNGYVTAPQHKEATKPDYGYIFYKCNLTDDGKVNDGAMSLGRPWGDKATVSYIECKFSDAYSQEGSDGSHKIHRWNDWSNGATADSVDYSEYGSMDADGNPIMQTAVKGGSVLTAEQAANYTKANIFGTSNGNSGYTTAFDCDTALSNLKILAGLEEGEIKEDPVKKYDLLGYTGGQLQGSNNGTGEYLGIKIDATNGKFNNRGNDIQINEGTILYVPMAENYEVSLTDKDGALSTSKYSVSYVDLEDVHYAKITFIGGSSYVISISVNTEKTVSIYNVSFDLNGATGTAPEAQQVVGGGKLLSVSDPVWEGHTFDGWYTSAEGGEKVELSSYTVTAGGTLYAHWTEGTVTKVATLIDTAKEFNFGKSTSGATAITKPVENKEDNIDELLVNGTFKSNGSGWYSISANTTVKIKVAAGLKVVITVYSSGNKFNVQLGEGEAAAATVTADIGAGGNPAIVIDAQSAETEITLTCISSDYIGAIQVIAAE